VERAVDRGFEAEGQHRPVRVLWGSSSIDLNSGTVPFFYVRSIGTPGNWLFWIIIDLITDNYGYPRFLDVLDWRELWLIV
jgi:hypothetical protein